MGLKFLHGLLEVKDCSVPLLVEPVIMMSLLLGEVTLELRLAPLQREWDAKPYYSHINWRQLVIIFNQQYDLYPIKKNIIICIRGNVM